MAPSCVSSSRYSWAVLPLADRFVGVIVFQLIEREGNTIRERDGFGYGLGVIPEQPRHFFRWLEMALGIGFEPFSGIVQREMFADAGNDILQFAPLMGMIKNVVGGD